MNRNDRRVLIAALVVGVIVLTGIFFLGGESSSNPSKRGEETKGKERRNIPYAVAPSQQPETFYFDPNTADSTQLLRLGLQPWQVRNIYKYRAKGGVYQKKEDFARLYGLTVKDYRRLEPYIRISSDYLPAATLLKGRKEEKDRNSRSDGNYGSNKSNENNANMRYPVKIRENEHIVLNTADTAQLQRVPGIGKYYAKEIARYGQWLGGYVNVDQLDEIDQFPKESKKFFVIQRSNPHKLNVNKLTLQQLRRHPYINYYQAKAITDYRRLHGKIEDIRQLRFSSDFAEKDFQRLTPYIEY
jgi:DNA uptake protein ComE-like DNA-binding protein